MDSRKYNHSLLSLLSHTHTHKSHTNLILQKSNGDHLNAHGAGVIRVNSTFYLIGEDKSQGSSFLAVNCYSSVDLVQWKYEGALLSRTGTSGDLGPNRIVERPKVIYNDQTRKYVMWMHVDSSNYGDAKVGVATSDTVCGRKYEYKGSFRPLGMESRDMGLFKDDDGKAYLLTEDVRLVYSFPLPPQSTN